MRPTILMCLKAIVYLLWPTTVYAASITLGDTLHDVPLLAWLMVLIVSTLSGLAALLNRIKTDMPPNLALFVIAHMAGSLLAGGVAFLVGEQADVADMAEAVSIALAAYAGAALMDKWAAKFTDKVTQ
jgi:peptidoglycan/LPS O-acetylase OafA/YrhL